MRIGNTPSSSSYYQSIENQQKAMLRIATGQRLNQAADDAVAVVISQGLRNQINGLDQGTRNTRDSVSLLYTSEGAMSNSSDITQRMRELNLQASNGTYTDEDRAAMQQEMTQLREQLNTTATNTEFNTIKTNNGSLNNFITQTGANSGQTVSFSIADTSAEALGINTDVSTQMAAMSNLESIDQGLNNLTTARADVGAVTNRLTISGEVSTQTSSNLQAAESRMKDSDIAKEMSLFQQSNVGMYAAMMVLSKNMNTQQGTLSLLA